MWRLRVRTQTQYCDEMHFSAFFISASQDGRIYAWEEISFYYIDLLAEKLENLTHVLQHMNLYLTLRIFTLYSH